MTRLHKEGMHAPESIKIIIFLVTNTPTLLYFTTDFIN